MPYHLNIVLGLLESLSALANRKVIIWREKERERERERLLDYIMRINILAINFFQSQEYFCPSLAPSLKVLPV